MATALRSFARPNSRRSSVRLCARASGERIYGRFDVLRLRRYGFGLLRGVQGLRTFLRASAIPGRLGNELNPAACRTYRRNVGPGVFICDDVWRAIDTLPSQTDVLIGGSPLSGHLSQRQAGRGQREAHGSLQGDARSDSTGSRPKVFVAENVRGSADEAHQRAIHQVVEDFEDSDKVSYKLYLAAHYGVPQTRERLFIVGTSSESKEFVPPHPLKRKPVTAKEAIADLERLRNARQIITSGVEPTKS